MKERIQTLDGLRFLAALGVLWIHAWSAFGNPRFYIANVDITNFLSVGGNGVDLFFVISGFCMYYFYANKVTFTIKDFYRFIKKRWLRLSPAFYIATIVHLLLIKGEFQLPVILTSLFYLNSILTQYSIGSHFWTLAVEWQFYFIIPMILVGKLAVGFNKIFYSIFASLAIIAIISVFLLKSRSDILTNQIVFRGIEFAWGILVARTIIERPIKLYFRGLWLLLFIIITYGGRVLISKPILILSPYYYNIFKLAGFTFMGLGFAGILYLALTSNGWLNFILSNRFFRTMGKISYSFYLWHALVLTFVLKYMPLMTPISNQYKITAPVIVTIMSVIILYPISKLSYIWLEKPFLSAGNLTSK